MEQGITSISKSFMNLKETDSEVITVKYDVIFNFPILAGSAAFWRCNSVRVQCDHEVHLRSFFHPLFFAYE